MSDSASETGVVTGASWAYCNTCKWKGPDRFGAHNAHDDLARHMASPEHMNCGCPIHAGRKPTTPKGAE